eukprot:Skav206127  [mRNA]  locus=scaffold172:305355:307130:+ [translate_table: standard]
MLSSCDSDRFKLNLRLEWSWTSDIEGIENRSTLTSCPDVMDSVVMAEIARLVFKMNRFRTWGRYNVTSRSQAQSDWMSHSQRTMHHLANAEKIIETLLLRSSLYDYFHPAQLGNAVFFHVAKLVRSLYFFLPSLVHNELPQNWRSIDPIWQSLESSLLHDGPLNVGFPSQPESCSLLSAVHDLLKADDMRIRAGSDWSGVRGQEIKQSLDSAQQQLLCMHQKIGGRFLKHFTFPKAFVFFGLLDRLDCRKVRAINPAVFGEDFVRARNQTFWMHLVPAQHVESNHVRGKGDFHCSWDPVIKEQINISLSRGSDFRFVEVGASLGGCTWRVLTSHPRAVALAVEPYKPAVDALKLTALENGLMDRLTIAPLFVSTKSACPNMIRTGYQQMFVSEQPGGSPVESDCATATLSDILTTWTSEPVDFLRIHVQGFELDVLRSLAKSLPKIRSLSLSIWTHRDSPEDYNPAAIARFLQDSGCSIVLDIRALQRDMPPVLRQLRDDAVVTGLLGSEIWTDRHMALTASCGSEKEHVCILGFMHTRGLEQRFFRLTCIEIGNWTTEVAVVIVFSICVIIALMNCLITIIASVAAKPLG